MRLRANLLVSEDGPVEAQTCSTYQRMSAMNAPYADKDGRIAEGILAFSDSLAQHAEVGSWIPPEQQL